MRLLPLMLLSLACGGSSGPGKFMGTVLTNTLTVKEALLVANSEVWLSDATDLCGKLSANKLPANATIVKLALRPAGTGEFAVTASGTASQTATATFLKLNATCSSTLPFQGSIGTKGTITVNRFVGSEVIDGTFDMTFGDSDAVTGSFSGKYCNAATSYPSAECVDSQ